MTRLPRPQTDLFKTPALSELSPSRRTAALKLLTRLLIEVISTAEPRRDDTADQEAGDDKDHA
jgi:hypothetical protein